MSSGPIAVVGMSCLFPMAGNLSSFWSNIVAGRDCLRKATPADWNGRRYDDRTDEVFGKIYCSRGGFISELASFNPLKFGVMPASVDGGDPDQFLALRIACEAMEDAGYDLSKQYPFERAEVILGRTSAPGAGSLNLIQHGQTVDQIVSVVSSLHPEFSKEELELLALRLHKSLRPCNSDTIAGVMPNILAGRVAGRLGFKGRSMLVDSACASSLIAVETAMAHLRSKSCDLALAGGIHINAFASFYQMFCGLGALSRTEEIRPFDENSDGTLLGEGLGMVVLKRLDEAVAAGDRIYAVLRGIGTSSDGRGTAMLAPSSEGEALAMARAYEDCGIAPQSVALLEAHGTGTPAGDVAELNAVKKIFSHRPASGEQSCSWLSIGSIKSAIGHTQAASGMAGLIKAALSLYHRILPATLKAPHPTSKHDWQTSPCYINHHSRPWIHPRVHLLVPEGKRVEVANTTSPRRAAVSAFGFGGVNAHVVMEEYEEAVEADRPSLLRDWSCELFLMGGVDRQSLIAAAQRVLEIARLNPHVKLVDLSHAINLEWEQTNTSTKRGSWQLAIIASSLGELAHRLDKATQALIDHCHATLTDEDGIYLADGTAKEKGKLAFVLPGLGAAYPNMLAQLCMNFPEVRAVFDYVDQLSLTNDTVAAPASDMPACAPLFKLPSKRVFPPLSPSGTAVTENAATLAAMDSAVVMVLMAEWAMFCLFRNLGIKADVLAGCSTGEFGALTMSGAVDILDAAPMFYRLSTAVSRAVSAEELAELRSIKVHDSWQRVEPIVTACGGKIFLSANLSPSQLLLSGARTAIDTLCQALRRENIEYLPLPAAIPYHTPLVEGKINVENDQLQRLPIGSPVTPVWSCSRTAILPADPTKIKKITTELFTQPIRLKETIEAMYADGARIFVELGPKDTLTPLIAEILGDRDKVAIASNIAAASETDQLIKVVACLAVHGVHMTPTYLTRRRAKPIDLSSKKIADQSAGNVMLKLSYPEVTLEAVPEELKSRLNEAGARQAWTDSPRVSAQYSTDASADNGELIMLNFMDSMNQFHQKMMSAQSSVMQALLKDPYPNSPAGGLPMAASETAALSRFPLMEGAQVHCSEDGAVQIDLPVSLHHHRYLMDHAIGGAIAHVGETSERVHLMPLTVALELMCEAASVLEPGKIVTRLDEIKALKRIKVNSRGTWLKLKCFRAGGDERQPGLGEQSIRASIVSASEPGVASASASDGREEPIMSCVVTFANEYGAPPVTPLHEANFDRPCTIPPDKLYADGLMFHGTTMRSVVRLREIGKKDITAEVTAREPEGWFPQPVQRESAFLIDPLLLDNCTQPVLFYIYEQGEKAQALLPFFVDRLEIFQSIPSLQETLPVWARMHSATERGTDADVYLIDKSGRTAARFKNITSRRILLDASWQSVMKQPASALAIVANHIDCKSLFDTSLPYAGERIALSSASIDSLPLDETTLHWCTDYFLSSHEQSMLSSIKRPDRRREWIAARLAAKCAAAKVLHEQLATAVLPAEITILADNSGQPQVYVQRDGIDGQAPLVLSIAHKGNLAVAACSSNATHASLGIDIEEVASREEGFEELALTVAEQEQMRGRSGEERWEYLAKLWAGKEAVGKAFGTGLSNNPKSVEILALKNFSGSRQAIEHDNRDNGADTFSGTMQSNGMDLPTVEVHCGHLAQMIVALCAIPAPMTAGASCGGALGDLESARRRGD